MPNTGKSKWLQMLNYLLVSEDTPADAFGEDVAKYTSVMATVTVAGEVLELNVGGTVTPEEPSERQRGKSTSKGLPLLLHARLDMPLLHYPQGNPLRPQGTWPELGCCSLYRHMYRRQSLWWDIADRQPESEQHACIVQFSGLAENRFRRSTVSWS